MDRGAEIAFMAIGSELARLGDEVTLMGAGPARPAKAYRFIQSPAAKRERFERWPTLPMLRGNTAWEELTFLPGLLRHYRPHDYDVTLTCSFPFTNMALRRPRLGGPRPPHVFVTQNGDWPAFSDKSEFGLFDCEGLVCTNPDYQERNAGRYRTALIPNGVDVARFAPGKAEPESFGLDPARPVVLMVSALIESKNVADGIKAVAAIDDAVLVVAGDGPLRGELQQLADRILPGRYRTISVAADKMPVLYRSADLFLHLSRNESFGNVFIEALASGTPIVAHDLPRTRWILGDEAHYVAGEAVEAIAGALSAALAGKKAGSERRAASARKYDWASVASRYRDFLSEVIEASR